jgi:undecaprenyl-diphosphatase
VRPVWLAVAAAVAAALFAYRRRLKPLALAAGGLAAVAVAAYGFGLFDLPHLDTLLEDIGRTLGAWTYLLVAVVAFLEAAAFLGLLVPGETGIIAGGVVAGQGHIDIVVLIPLAWASAFAGDLTGYAFGRRLGRPFLLRHGTRFGLTPARVEQVDRFFTDHGGKAIFVGRFVGLVRSLSPFLAGSARMPLGRFVPYDILGSGIQSTLLCLLGYAFWHSLDTLIGLAKRGALALSTTIVVVTAIVVAVRWLRVPENRAAARAWLARHERRRVVGVVVRIAGRTAAGPGRFLYARVTPGDLGAELTALLAVASVAAYAFIGYLVVLGAGGLTPGDRRAATWSDAIRTERLDAVADAVALLGTLPVAGTAVAVVALGLLARRKVLEGAALLCGMAATILAAELGGGLVERPDGATYPSELGAYAVAWTAAAVGLRHALPRLAHRAALLALGIVLAAGVALARVYTRDDWLSDTVGGLALGALAFALTGAAALLVAYGLRRLRSASPPSA